MTNQKNIFFYHNHNPNIAEKLLNLQETVERFGFMIVSDYEDADIIASVGGDGAFLQAVRKTRYRQDCLYIGIAVGNTRGLYCDFHIDQIHDIIDLTSLEQIEVRKYPVIEVRVNGEGSFYCLNEFTIRSGIIKTFVLDIFIDGNHFETFRGDGLVISTPTGSAAYSKSLKGAVIDPLLPCFQVTEVASLNNNTFRSLGSPLVLTGNRTVTLRVVEDDNDHPSMAMDNEALSIRKVEEVQVTLSEKRVHTIRLEDNSFWDKIKRMFL